jgi:serine/threonine protein kinase
MTIRSDDWKGLALSNGRYVITTKLGEGGMGYVFRALDRNLEADVVIKIPRQAMMDDPEFAGRFTREIRSLVKLSHPHIVKVSDVGEWEGVPFAVMQYLPGGSLEDHRPKRANGQPLPCDPRMVSRWLVPVAQALDYVHAQGYVHRDVKPGNILFDAEGHSFLGDFGVAKVLASAADVNASRTAMTGTGMVLGTPEYMAPELIMGEPFDGRADQYALAVTFYELLCGRRPFEHETKTKVLVLHTSKAPPRLTEWCPALPERLSQAVLKGLAKDPDERFLGCAALAAAVAAASEGAAGREERVKLKCPRCGKAGGMPAADYAKLRDGGSRPSCPTCKVPLDEVRASKEQAALSGTMTISRPVTTGGYPVASPPARGGTVAMSAPKSLGEKPTDPEPRPISPRPSPKTLVEPAAPPPTENAAALIALTVQQHPLADGARGVAGSHLSPAQKWVAVGAGAAASLVALTFVVVGLLPRKEANVSPQPAAPKTAAVASPRVPSVPPAPSTWPESPPPGEPDAPRPNSTRPPENAIIASASPGPAPSSGTNKPESDPSAPAAGLASASRPGSNERRDPPPTGDSLAPLALRDSKLLPTRPPSAHFDPALLARKPTKGKYPLAKLLADAQSHPNGVVVPTGMYLLTRPQADQAGGRRKLWATERTIQSKRGNAVGMTSSTATELEVEPGLAGRLDSLTEDQLNDKMAIVTVWFPTGSACQLVKVEILERYVTGFKKGFAPRGDVDYETLVVTPQGSTLVKADDEEWEQPGRMLHFANAYKNRVLAFKNMLQTKDQLQLQHIMENMWGQMMRDAATEAARQGALQRAVGGR